MSRKCFFEHQAESALEITIDRPELVENELDDSTPKETPKLPRDDAATSRSREENSSFLVLKSTYQSKKNIYYILFIDMRNLTIPRSPPCLFLIFSGV